MNAVYINAGSFKDYGGWVLDTQFIPNMGSEYLLAHGLGIPVNDAVTEAEFPRTGTYRMWVFTKDWVAHWKKDMAPGTFKITAGEQTSSVTFGTNGEKWNWQDGGTVEIDSTVIPVTVHDLTGFEGRFAAILFTDDLDFIPPDDIAELIKMHRKISNQEQDQPQGSYDLVVAGGGIAGMSAAVMAARKGLKTILIQDRDVVGGNNSSEVRVWLGAETNFPPLPKMGDITREFDQEKEAHYGCSNVAELYEDDKKMAILKAEPNLSVFTGFFVTDAETENGIIKAVTAYDVRKGLYYRIEAKLFADCTGDGCLAHYSKAHYEITTNGHMGMNNHWHIEKTSEPQSFPRCPWAIDLSNSEFPGRKNILNHYGVEGEEALGCWYWESGMELDPIEYAEYTRDTNFRAMYGAVDCIKNTDGDYPDYILKFASYIGGKRESRRILGDVIVTKADAFSETKFPDGIVPSTWNFDVHYPNKRFYTAFHEGDAFLTYDYHEPFPKPFWIPYRCLYSRNVANLFMAGRDVSVSHDALGTARIMRTCGMMGEAVGAAAKICITQNVLPRDVYNDHLDELLSNFR